MPFEVRLNDEEEIQQISVSNPVVPPNYSVPYPSASPYSSI
jgi:hypothetical protein